MKQLNELYDWAYIEKQDSESKFYCSYKVFKPFNSALMISLIGYVEEIDLW